MVVSQEEEKIYAELSKFDCISLQEMSNVKLMNRMDTKYVTSIYKILETIPCMQEDYLVQKVSNTIMSHYHTIYYDTEDYKMYLEHHNKHYPRQKVRIREYVESGQYFLEIKNKTNKSRTQKERIQIESFDIEQDNEVKEFLNNNSRYSLSEIYPSLDDQFIRITLTNKQLSERITIDFSLCFHNPRTLLDYNLPQYAIIELKQDIQQFSKTKDIFIEHQIRKSQFSKACLGQVLTNPAIKHNLFKEQLHKLIQ